MRGYGRKPGKKKKEINTTDRFQSPINRGLFRNVLRFSHWYIS